MSMHRHKKEREVHLAVNFPKYPFKKFEHVPMAIINPTPESKGAIKKNRTKPKDLIPDSALIMQGNTIELKPNLEGKKALPSHLEKPFIYISKLVSKPKKGKKANEIGRPRPKTALAKSGKLKVDDSETQAQKNWNLSTHVFDLEQQRHNELYPPLPKLPKLSKEEDLLQRQETLMMLGTNEDQRMSIIQDMIRGQRQEKIEKEKLYQANQTLEDDTIKLFGFIKKGFIGKSEKINPNKAEKDLHSAYKALLEKGIIEENKKEIRADIIGIFKQQKDRSTFLKKQQDYSQRVSAMKSLKEEHKRDQELLGIKQNPFESFLEDQKFKVKIGPEKTLIQLQQEDQKAQQVQNKKNLQLAKLRFSEAVAELVPKGKNPEIATKYHITKNLFLQFILAVGVDMNNLKIAGEVFDFYAEVVRRELRSPGENMLNLRVFIFNFKKWLTDKYQKKNLVSSKKARDNNSILREYLKESEALTPAFRLEKISKKNEDLKKEVMKLYVSPREYLLLGKKDFELFNYDQLKEVHLHNREYMKEYNGKPINLANCIKEYEARCGALLVDLKQKKILTDFLISSIQPNNIHLDDLLQTLEEMTSERAEYLQRMGALLQQYKETKVMFKEETFNLYDIANHIYTQISEESDNDLMFYLVAKFKKHINTKEGNGQHFEIDPKKSFNLKELDNTFHRICDKTQAKIRTVGDILQKLEDDLSNYQRNYNNEKVSLAVHENVVATFFIKLFDDIDHNIEDPAVVALRMDAVYWNEIGGSFEVTTEASNQMHYILGIPKPKAALTNVLQKLAFNPKGVVNESKVIRRKEVGNLLGKTVRFLDDKKQHDRLNDPSIRPYLNHAGDNLMSSLANYTKENPSSASGPIHLERIRQTHVEMGNVYPTILPTDYYKNIIDRERVLEESGSNPWYVRPHHLETLTEHPYSLKDNVMDSNYYSYYSALERDFKGGYLSQEETDARQAPTETDNLISTLESQLQNLRSQLGSIEARRAESGDMERVPGGISSMMLQPYYDVPQDINYESKAKAYESVLDQLRNQERAILNQKREQEMEQFGAPHDRWYEDAGPNFAREMKKYDKIRDMGIQEREYIRKLGNNELY